MADPEKFEEQQSQLDNSQQLIAVYRALLYLLACKLFITSSIYGSDRENGYYAAKKTA